MREDSRAQTVCVCRQKRRKKRTKKIPTDRRVEYINDKRLIHVLQDIKIESSFTTFKTVGQ